MPQTKSFGQNVATRFINQVQTRNDAMKPAQQNLKIGCVVWLTGLSGAGKSTIAKGLEQRLSDSGKHIFVLDGDITRRGLCSDLTFSPADRRENVRRIGEVAKLFAEAGVICIVALISPYRADRQFARSIIGTGRFIEVYVNTSIETCEKRDPKGLYARARAGQLQEFTGISAPYEAPESPEIELKTDKLTVAESVHKIVQHLDHSQFSEKFLTAAV